MYMEIKGPIPVDAVISAGESTSIPVSAVHSPAADATLESDTCPVEDIPSCSWRGWELAWKVLLMVTVMEFQDFAGCLYLNLLLYLCLEVSSKCGCSKIICSSFSCQVGPRFGF